MRVLLSPSYQLELDPKQAAAGEPYPPLGTLYAAAYLREHGHQVVLSDSMLASGYSEYEADLDRVRPDLVVIYEDDFNYLSKMCLTNMREAAWAKARLAGARGLRVAAHGSDVSDRVEDYLTAGVEYVIRGEGEETLLALVQALSRDADGATLGRVSGLAYLNEGGVCMRTAERGFIRDLDRLPFPAWDLVDVERYRAAWLRRHDRFSINMVTTRGCPYHCNWCAKPIYGQRYNTRSPRGVAEELAWLKGVVKPDHVWFADDIFGLTPHWVEEFADEVDARGCATPFKIQARVDLIDAPAAEALRRAGCETVWVGAESGSQGVLDAMDKGTRVEQIYEATRLLRQQGIRIGYFLQFGYPGENWSDIAQTLAMVRKAQPDDIGISVSYPLPGTAFHDRVGRELGEKTNWAHSDDLEVMFRGTFHPQFYRALYRYVHHEFRLRKAWRARRNPKNLLRISKRLLGLVAARAQLAYLSRRKNPALGGPRPAGRTPTTPAAGFPFP